jgi:outer membrane immunogenic protein
MKKNLIATAALVALFCAPAVAADMAAPAYKAPPPPLPPPAWNWTGFYVGLNGGYGWNTDSVSFSAANAAAIPYFTTGAAVPGSVTTNPQGGLFGGQIGYDQQWSNQYWVNFVTGIEADFDWADISGSGAVSTTPPVFAPFTTSAQQKLTSLGTVRGILGLAADRALLYVTGGLAYGRAQLNTSVITPGFCGPAGLCATASSTQWDTGWTVGGGAEWAFGWGWNGFGSGWRARIEYLYYDLGSNSQAQFDPADTAPIPVFNSSATFRGNIVRGGLNYQF